MLARGRAELVFPSRAAVWGTDIPVLHASSADLSSSRYRPVVPLAEDPGRVCLLARQHQPAVGSPPHQALDTTQPVRVLRTLSQQRLHQQPHLECDVPPVPLLHGVGVQQDQRRSLPPPAYLCKASQKLNIQSMISPVSRR